MSDAARLARETFATKPAGLPFNQFKASPQAMQSIGSRIDDGIIGSAYASLITFAEAIAAVQSGSASWAVVRFYYSCFYSIRALLLLEKIVPFNSSSEMLLDNRSGSFLKGGRSSHHWNWTSINSTILNGEWFCSQDSQEAYKKLRDHRENVNYTHDFTDPSLHHCLISDETDLSKRFRVYRDDDDFTYTYLDDHLAIAYPLKLLFYVDSRLKASGIVIPEEKLKHAKSLWVFKDRCPVI